MSYEKGQYAFFEGSSSAYRQTCKPAESIAGYKITAIGSDYVELQATNSKAIKMAVGTTIRREDNGPWSAPSARSETVFVDTGSRDSGSSRSSKSSGAPTECGGISGFRRKIRRRQRAAAARTM